MASVITNILCSTVGLLWNKARDFAAKKLKDGDTTDEKFREIIIRDLNDIKTTLDCLSRKDLLSSYSFLKEGVLLLNLALDQSNVKHTTAPEQAENGQNETSVLPKDGECGIFNEALTLAHATKRLSLVSNKHFKSAKDIFKTARERATEAFWNEGLNVTERIMACKLRVVARILECLENPDSTTTACRLFLEELHGLSAVRQIFSVYLSGGLKSKLNKAERFENVKSVILTNLIIFEFTAKFGGKYPDVQCWPTIELSERNFNPARGWYEVWKQAPSDEMIQPPKHLVTEVIKPYSAVVNSRSEIITRSSGAIKIISSTKEIKVVNFPEPQDGELIYQVLMALAVDSKDNVYAIRWLQTQTNTSGNAVNTKSYVMYALDDNYDVQYQCTLEFLDATNRTAVRIATDNNDNIIVIANLDNSVYICDNTGHLRYKFERDQDLVNTLNISDKGELITIRSSDHKAVYIHTQDGIFTSTIKVPEGHIAKGVVFHYVISKIIVLTYNTRKDSFFLLCYSKKGELESSMFICKTNIIPNITSHPSGPVAVVQKRSITFI